VVPGNGGGKIHPGAPIRVEVERDFALKFSALFQAAMQELLPSVQERVLGLIREELQEQLSELRAEVDELRALAVSRPDQLEAVNAWRDQDEAHGIEYVPEEHPAGPEAGPPRLTAEEQLRLARAANEAADRNRRAWEDD
jgi:hypothetical protein